jgi:hypothetical protein
LKNRPIQWSAANHAHYLWNKGDPIDKEAKAKRHAEAFPQDCKRAFELGVRMAIK